MTSRANACFAESKSDSRMVTVSGFMASPGRRSWLEGSWQPILGMVPVAGVDLLGLVAAQMVGRDWRRHAMGVSPTIPVSIPSPDLITVGAVIPLVQATDLRWISLADHAFAFALGLRCRSAWGHVEKWLMPRVGPKASTGMR